MATAALATACSGCFALGGPSVPQGYLSPPGPGGPGRDGYGAWVVVRSGFSRDDRLEGELIVCRSDGLWVLTARGLRSVPLRKVRSTHLYTELGPWGDVRDQLLTSAPEETLRPWARFPQGWVRPKRLWTP